MSQSPAVDEPLTRAQAWTRYWSSGVQHSCPGSFAANYTGRIGDFWKSVFEALPSDARVLDACCGNAPMSQMLLDSDYGARVARVDAVDAAEVAPQWLDAASESVRARFVLHAGADVAALPLDDATFDLCMSQYGIEYVGEAAFRECGRVLRPGGRLAAVLHHVDALPVRIAHEECAHIDFLLEDDGLLARAQTLIEPLASAATTEGRDALRSDAAANAARGAFNEALRAIKERVAAARYPDVLIEQREVLMHLLAAVPGIGLDAAGRHLEEMREALVAARLRQQELPPAALDEAGVRALVDVFGGRIERLDPLHFENGEIAGWALVATRA